MTSTIPFVTIGYTKNDAWNGPIVCPQIPAFGIARARAGDALLRNQLVARAPVHPRTLVREVSHEALIEGITPGMPVDWPTDYARDCAWSRPTRPACKAGHCELQHTLLHFFPGPHRHFPPLRPEAGIPRRDMYVTNAMKHFKWEPQSRRRKHKKLSAAEIAACRPWLDAEIQVVKPRAIVCPGVTAAHSVFGKVVRLHELKGTALVLIENDDRIVLPLYKTVVH